MIPTLVNYNNLSNTRLKAFDSVLYKYDWTENLIKKLPNNFYHPIKDLNYHKYLRNIIKNI
jgi:hypothetical protein